MCKRGEIVVEMSASGCVTWTTVLGRLRDLALCLGKVAILQTMPNGLHHLRPFILPSGSQVGMVVPKYWVQFNGLICILSH
jgi:hypothetical protein